jgi:hypothetical protein
MARTKKHTPKVDFVRPYLEGVAKNLVDKLYGPDGPPDGTRLTDIENLLLELRAVLSQEMLDLALARQADAQRRSDDAHTCPSCQQPLACGDANPRSVQTRAGLAQWSEPQGYCRRCRRAFFPSVARPGS